MTENYEPGKNACDNEMKLLKAFAALQSVETEKSRVSGSMSAELQSTKHKSERHCSKKLEAKYVLKRKLILSEQRLQVWTEERQMGGHEARTIQEGIEREQLYLLIHKDLTHNENKKKMVKAAIQKTKL